MQKLLVNQFLLCLTVLLLLHGTFRFVEINAENDDGNILLKEVICKSATIRTIEDFNQLENCTLVAGHIRIVHVNLAASAFREVKPSNIEEISEYLLVYRVQGLDTLEKLFPKLIVIRGVELLYDQYALIILENRDLKNIGLVSLLRVLKGSIRVESNPALCFSNTINWVWILDNTTKKYFYAIENNKPEAQCPLCYTYSDEFEGIDMSKRKHCWSMGKYQKTLLDYTGGSVCKNDDSNCLTSCSNRNCRHCTNFVSDEGCVTNCLPPKFKLAFNRQCVTNCTQWGLVQLGIKCVEKCPKHYQEVKRNGVSACNLNCSGNFMVHNESDLDGLAECTILSGSLTIELHEADEPIVHHLERAFRNLNEITGYLKIVNSPQIVSLHFFKNLHTIRGSELLDNMYAVYVVDNSYLQELWLGNVAILRGCVYFHLNPRLCYQKITELQKNFKECKKITIKDVSPNSNGERVVCGEDVRSINATITDINSNSAVVQLDLLPGDELLLIVGYIYYYKEAPYRNVTKYEGRHGCGSDGWFTDTVLTQRRRHILKYLKPGTQYAYFVNSMTVMYYPYMAEHVSEIQYFTTLPAKPGKVAKIFALSLPTSEIEVHWWPPLVTNGVLEKYMLQYEPTNATKDSEPSYQPATEVCQCPKLETESKVPTPHVDNFYEMEKLSSRDAIMNFLFVKKNYSNDTLQSDQSNAEGKERYHRYLNESQFKDIAIQEEDRDSYVLPHPLPVCYATSSKDHHHHQHKGKKKCIPLEKYEDAIEIPSNRHSYLIVGLEPEQVYRISVRACVKDLVNGCGPEKVILTETMSKGVETIMRKIRHHNF